MASASKMPLDKLLYVCYTICMSDIYTTVRIHKTTARKLRLIATLRGETIISTLRRLADADLHELHAEHLVEVSDIPSQRHSSAVE